MAERHRAEMADCLSEESNEQTIQGKTDKPHEAHGPLPTYEELGCDDNAVRQQGMSTVSNAASARPEIGIHDETARPGGITHVDSSLEGIGTCVDQTRQSIRLPNKGENAFGDTTSGLMRGAKSLAVEFGKGFTGIITEPLKGALQDGASGFGKGLVRGSLGVVFRPVYGTCTFATCTWKGMRSDIARAPGRGHHCPHTSGIPDPCCEVRSEPSGDDNRSGTPEPSALSGRPTTEIATMVTLESQQRGVILPRLSSCAPPVDHVPRSDSHSSTREASTATLAVKPSQPAPPIEGFPPNNGDLGRCEEDLVEIRQSVIRMTDNVYSGVLETGRKVVIVKEGQPSKVG